MDLARLGVDEIGLDLVAVTPEERVRERAVAPVDAATMEVDEERRHRVEQPVAVDDRPGRQPHQEAAVLERVGEVGRSPGSPRSRSGASARPTGVTAGSSAASSRRRTSYSVRAISRGSSLSAYSRSPSTHEPDEMARWSDRQLLELHPVTPASRRAAAPTAARGGRAPRSAAGGAGMPDALRRRRGSVRAASAGRRSRWRRSPSPRRGGAPPADGGPP